MDFDDLKRAWHDCDHNLDASINLNSRRLRSVLRLNAEVSTNRSTPGDVDYTMPVVVAQRQSHAHWFARIGRGVAAWITKACRADEIAGRLQSTAMRVLCRHRTLRG